MANYQALDAYGSVITVASSVISSVNYPIVKISDPVSVVGTLNVNPGSVSGTVGASIIGLPTVQTGNNSVIGVIQGSVATAQIGAWSASVVGSVSAYLQSSGASVVTVNQGSSIIAINAGSVVAIPQGSVITVAQGSIATVQMGQIGTQISSISGQVTVVSSIAGGIFPVSGSVSAVVTNNVTVVSSIAGGIFPVSGSVMAISTNLGSIITLNIGSVITVWKDSSILSVPVGSVITLNQGSSILAVPIGSTLTVWDKSPSIVGTYAEDAASADADKGLFVLGVRNDAVASLVSNNLDYTGMALDAAGRSVIKPFSSEDGTIISYASSVVSTSVTLIQASAIGKKSYITDFFIANTGAAATLVTFKDGSTSIIGNTIAPAGGGSNAPGLNIPIKTAVSQDLVFTGVTATSVLYLTVKGYQAP